MNGIEQKYVNELLDYEFIIPEYQRGYKWTKDEVDALLEDIFNCEKDSDYCLQPLVVKKMEENKYEVVDGQQRLTTTFLYLKYVEKKEEVSPFKISYVSRDKSESFLQNIDNIKEVDDSNIDYYYMSTAYLEIDNWINKKVEKINKIDGAKKYNSANIKNKISDTLTSHTFFIWKEIPNDESCEDIFNKVNEGKIKLTNSELIKAIMFNKDNFEDRYKDRIIELSLWWDKIEQGLQDDSFWYFFNEKGDYENRIDILFETLAKKYNIENVQLNTQEDHKTFLIYYNAYMESDNKNNFIKELQREIDNIYEKIKSWYRENELYHLLGYLVTLGFKIFDILQMTYKKNKSEIKDILFNAISKYIKFDENDIEKIDYNDKNCKNYLLLHNIATLIIKSEKQYRFPFDIYKKNQWDKEHIHATADNTDEPDDNISNMALLSADINREYKDASFGEKRDCIIGHVKEGKFVPICTQNVFLKQYTDSNKISNMDLWTEDDKQSYLKNIVDIFKKFKNCYKEVNVVEK